MTKEEEEYIKQQERNRELMEEIAREIEITCLGKLKWLKKEKKGMITITTTIIKTLNEQVFPCELQAILNSLPLWDSWEGSLCLRQFSW